MFYRGVTILSPLCHRLSPFRFTVLCAFVKAVSYLLEGIVASLQGITLFADRFLASDTTLGVLGAWNGKQTDCRGSVVTCKQGRATDNIYGIEYGMPIVYL